MCESDFIFILLAADGNRRIRLLMAVNVELNDANNLKSKRKINQISLNGSE